VPLQRQSSALIRAEAIVSIDSNLLYVALAGAKGKMMTRIGNDVGLKVIYEAFPDRAYTAEGNLVSRREPGAVIKEPKCVIAIDGSSIPFEVDTLCVHGDTPTAVELTKSIREALESEGVELLQMRAMD